MVKTYSKEQLLVVRAANWSLLIAVIVLALKFYAYFETHSTAVLSDALEGIINVAAAFLSLFIMRAVVEPKDSDHPYGHGKLEYFSAAFEGGLIFFAALAIGYESLNAMWNGKTLDHVVDGIAVIGFAAVLNLAMGLYLARVGRKHQSEALMASSKHILSDVVTTVGSIVGLILVHFTGLTVFDSIAALVVGAHLAYVSYGIVRNSAGALIDEKDERSLNLLTEAIKKSRKPWVIDIHDLRMARFGSFHHIDAHLVIPEFWDIQQAHNLTLRLERDVVEAYPFQGEIAFHLDPCERSFCQSCDLQPCPVRVKDFVSLTELSVESVTRNVNE